MEPAGLLLLRQVARPPPTDQPPWPRRTQLQMGACLDGQNSAPCVKLSPLFKNNCKCEVVEKNNTSQSSMCANSPAAGPQGHGRLTQSA